MSAFPDDWSFQEAHKVCSHIVDCINKTAPVVEYQTPYKMIRTTNVKSGCINLDEARCVDEATFLKWNRRLTPELEDIVLTREAPLGDVGLIRTMDKVFLGQRTMLYRANPEILNQRFLYYTLLGPTLQAQLKTLGSGSTVEHVRVPDAEKLIIPFPKIGIQKKIAAILSAYDDLIENNKRRIALLEKMAEEIYREWFVRFRFPGYQTAEFEKGIPKGWVNGNIGSLYAVRSGYAFKSVDLNVTGQYPVVKIGNIDESGVTLDGCQYFNGDLDSRISKFELFAGDFLVAMTGAQIGKTGVFRNFSKRCFLNQRVGKFFPHKAELKSNAFISLFARTGYFREAIEITAHGAAQPNISGAQIEKVDLILPPSELIYEFENVVKPFFDQIFLLMKASESLGKTKGLLLPRLISGKLSVENLDIQFPPSMQETI